MQIKKVIITGKQQVELKTVNSDEVDLKRDEVFIETQYSFISAGTELSIFNATEERVYQPGFFCTYPCNSGYANVGVVRAIGEGVTVCKPGQRVFTFGPHASHIKLKQKSMIIEVPQNMDGAMAAASRMAGVATTGIYVSDIGKNDWVVVFGLGMVGNIAAQAYQALGCRVIGVDLNEARREIAKECGVSHVIGGNQEEVQEAISNITGKQMANIAVDAVGHSKVVIQALQATAQYGQLILLGSPRVPVEGNITEILADIHRRNITVRGALEWCLPDYSEFAGRDSLYTKQQMIFDWIERGILKIKPMISHVIDPARINEAYMGLTNQPDLFTGIVLDWTDHS